MAGVSIPTVAEILGHKTLAMTQRYSLRPAENADVAEEWLQNSGKAMERCFPM